MLEKQIAKILREIADRLDAGTSGLPNEEEAIQVMKNISYLTDRHKPLSAYQVCQKLHICRATLDNYIREGKLPKGDKTPGMSSLTWEERVIDDFIAKNKKKKS